MTQIENFKNFLMIEGSYEKFCDNLMKQRGRTFENTVNSRDIITVIDDSFSWNDCPEVDGYWAKLNSKWRIACNNSTKFNNQCRSIW